MEAFKFILSQMTITDAMDILLVTYLIYQGILIIQGTRAVQMLMGVGSLAFLLWLGRTYHLYSLNWILDHFFNSFFIIAIVLFQDQFRNALANFGKRGTALGWNQKEVLTEEIDECILAFEKMSAEKIGAIIVFEGESGLGDVIDTGTLTKSEVHADIIYALFRPQSPLHDGALVIREGKIWSAGCFLPLSHNVELDKRFGTRHRAALGVTENSDCMAIVVSEESGEIRFFYDGDVFECSNGVELRHYLMKVRMGKLKKKVELSSEVAP